MTEHERIILQAAANILSGEHNRIRSDSHSAEWGYTAGCARYAAEEIENFLARYDDAAAPVPQSLRVKPETRQDRP